MATLNYPFGAKDRRTVTAAAATAGVPINAQWTEIVISPALTANQTFNAVLSAELRVGAILEITWLSDSTARTCAGGTGFIASSPAQAGTISDSSKSTYIFNGTAFELQSHANPI